MRLKLMLISFILLSHLSCDEAKEIPENVLSEEKMVSVLVDVQLLEATYNNRMLHLDNRDEKMQQFFDEIFEHHQINRENFNESYTFYAKDPKQLEHIYELVFEQLEKMLTEEEAKYKDNKAKPKLKALKTGD